jgi:hypothetical protein
MDSSRSFADSAVGLHHGAQIQSVFRSRESDQDIGIQQVDLTLRHQVP